MTPQPRPLRRVAPWWPGVALLPLILAALCWAPHHAKAQVIDRIIAIVDDEIILQSDLDQQYNYMVKSGQKDDGTLRCAIFESMLMEQLLLAKARLDSLTVDADEVENELNRRLAIITQQMGSIQAVEEVNGKSILELRVEMRPLIEEELLVDKQKRTIYSGVTITPKEVKDFFKSIPTDSLPYLPAEVEISHIVVKPKPSQKSKQEAKQKLETYLDLIKSGKGTFEQMAKLYSEDPGSRQNGGSLGEFGRGEMVPEFEEVVYSLQPGQISDVFESPFGFHVIRLEKRIGERVQASHILLRPKIEKEDEQICIKKLQDVLTLIKTDSLTFEEAAFQYSEDDQSRMVGGRIRNPNNGEYQLSLDQLDAELYFQVDDLKPGEISEPVEYLMTDGGYSKGFRIIQLRKKYPPHKASLATDYQKFYSAALQSKQALELEKWFQKAREQVFVTLKLDDCKQMLESWYE